MAPIQPGEHLPQVVEEITRLLSRHQLLDQLAQRQEGPRRALVEQLQHRQNVAELDKYLRGLHPADIGFALEALAPESRVSVWRQLTPEQAGLVLMEVPPAVRHSLFQSTERDDLIRLLLTLEAEDIAFIADSLDAEILDAVTERLQSDDRVAFDEVTQYAGDSVGRYMTRDVATVQETELIQQALAQVRGWGALPPQTDRVFAVDARNVLRGSLALSALVLADPSRRVSEVMTEEPLRFTPHDEADAAARAFERYDLVSAPVVDERGKLAGRLTVDAVMDFVRDEAQLRTLKEAGLSGDEDLFAGAWQSARNRWPWLAINLVTAFIASRVIGRFEGEIQSLASLAALMPIVASIGGNTGNQTMALVVRGLALDRIQPGGVSRVVYKEVRMSLLNGLVWGVVVGVAALALYSNLALGIVMSIAVVLNLIVAALAGVGVPLALHAKGRDPVHGASVILTFITDAMGFFLFLSLASIFLL